MQECESSSFSELKIVGNSSTETNVAMELCKKVQVEEYVIHVVGSTNFHTHLQVSLLASTWFPHRLGVCLWSALHMLLVLYEALMLLILFPTIFVLAVLTDAFIVGFLIYMVLAFPFMAIAYFLVIGIEVALVWLWLVITCQCCTMPGRAPGQGLGRYIFTAGGTLGPQDPQPAAVVETGGAATTNGFCAFLKECWRASITLSFVNHVMLVSFPYRRAQLGDLCREIVPLYDTIVI